MLLGLAASVASLAGGPIAPAAAASAAVASWISANWERLTAAQQAAAAAGGHAGAVGVGEVAEDAPLLAGNVQQAAGVGEDNTTAAAVALGTASRQAAAAVVAPGVVEMQRGGPSTAAATAVGDRFPPAGSGSDSGHRQEVLADGREALSSTSTTLLSMVQQIATLRRGLLAGGDGATDGQLQDREQAGSLLGQSAGAGSGQGAGAAAAAEEPPADDNPFARAIREREQLLMRALASVQRLAALVHQRDSRWVVVGGGAGCWLAGPVVTTTALYRRICISSTPNAHCHKQD
jgi:hypothetical protein